MTKSNARTLSRQSQIRDEVYLILQTEAANAFKRIQDRDDVWTKRLAAVEKNGVPDGVLEDIKKDISQLTYVTRKNTQAIEALLAFFKASEAFINQTKTP